jgi:RHS repeat-associated protein
MTGLQRYLSSTAPDCSDWTDYSITESRGYNVNGQLTSKSFSSDAVSCHVPTSLSGGFTYTYSATENNGQITQVNDAMSGETIVYNYDSLKRLIAAGAAPNVGSTPTAWTQTFQYDGFGNLTAKVLNGTTSSIGVTAATNRLSGSSYDLNGNMLTGMGATLTYDEANRVASATPISGGTEYYGYGPDNRRVYRLTATGGEAFTFYGGHGEDLGDYWFDDVDGYGRCRDGCYLWPGASKVWFAGMLVWDGGGGTAGAPDQDRVGTNRVNGARFYPYGDELTSATGSDRVKFATYERSSFTGLDYAQARYYASAYGRFTTVDPDGSSANPKRPISWNRYIYASDDPVNRNDPSGRIDCWSWYQFLINTTDDIPDSSTLGNCEGGESAAWLEFDPCSINSDLLASLNADLSCDVAPPSCYDASSDACAGGGGSGAPSAAQGGGAGASGAPAVLSSFSFTQLQTQATAALNYELNNLGPNCDKVLPVGTLQSDESFTPLTFWNATTQGSTPASLLGGTNGGTIGSYFGRGQYAVILNGTGGSFINQVVLGANFYSDPSSQGLTLLHELLHFALQEGDAAIDRSFGINIGVEGASGSFSKWLANDCNN